MNAKKIIADQLSTSFKYILTCFVYTLYVRMHTDWQVDQMTNTLKYNTNYKKINTPPPQVITMSMRGKIANQTIVYLLYYG